jgi:hypothetical protein
LTRGASAALTAQRNREIRATDAALREELKRLFALEDEIRLLEEAARQAQELADKRKALLDRQADAELRMIELTRGASAALEEQRRRELDATDKALHAELKRIWAIEDEIRLLEEAAKAAEERAGLMIRLAEAQGRSEDALRMRRDAELASASETNRAILLRIYALEDEARALEAVRAAASNAFSALERSVQAEKARISETADAQLAAIQAQKEAQQAAHKAALDALNLQQRAAQEALSAAQAALGSIQSALSSLRNERPPDLIERARAARELSQWAALGVVPDKERLDRTLEALAKTDANEFASQADYLAAQGQTYANLLKLEKAGLRQVDWAEATVQRLDTQIEQAAQRAEAQQLALDAAAAATQAWRDAELARLDGVLESAKAQLDALMGIDTTLLSVEDALQQFLTAVSGELSGQSQPPEPPPVLFQQLEAQQEQTDQTIALREELVLLRKDLAAIHTAQVIPLKALEDRLRKWDLDGTPPVRDDGTTPQQVVVLRAG